MGLRIIYGIKKIFDMFFFKKQVTIICGVRYVV